MTATDIVRPFNQRIRIWALRASFALAFPLILFTDSAWSEPEWLFEIVELLGLFMIIGAVLGRFWAILYIGSRKNREIMRDGPYSICRHPLYLFSTVGVVGLGFMLGSLVVSMALGAVVFAILSATASREERFLRQEFGSAYDAYAAAVPRVWPKLSQFRTPPVIAVSVSALKMNFADALVFLAFIPLAEFMEGLRDMHALPSVALY